MSSNKKKEPEVKNTDQETPETPQRPCGLPRGISEVLDHIMNDKKKPMTLSERIIKLARDRDFIFDRINEWDEDIKAQNPTGETVAIARPIAEVREAMVAYKNSLGAAIKYLLELT